MIFNDLSRRPSSLFRWVTTVLKGRLRLKAGRVLARQVILTDSYRLILLVMADRVPRRSNNIILSAQQLDYNASMARDLNKRAHNRLQLHKGNIEEHQTANLNSMNYEMRRIKHELKDIANSSGTLDQFGEKMASKARNDTARRGKKFTRMESGKNVRKGKMSDLSTNAITDGNKGKVRESQNSDILRTRRKSLSLPTLPSMNSTSVLTSRVPPDLTSRTNTEFAIREAQANSSRFSSKLNKETAKRRQSRRKLSLEATTSSGQATEQPISVSVTDTSGETERIRPASPRGAPKADSLLVNLSLDAVKDRIQNRLSQPPNQFIDDDNEDSDITPYMHVPPDGLPRTVYLLPPLQDLLQEAKKARYVRRPRKPFQVVDKDDPERELGIDEIFSKKG